MFWGGETKMSFESEFPSLKGEDEIDYNSVGEKVSYNYTEETIMEHCLDKQKVLEVIDVISKENFACCAKALQDLKKGLGLWKNKYPEAKQGERPEAAEEIQPFNTPSMVCPFCGYKMLFSISHEATLQSLEDMNWKKKVLEAIEKHSSTTDGEKTVEAYIPDVAGFMDDLRLKE